MRTPVLVPAVLAALVVAGCSAGVSASGAPAGAVAVRAGDRSCELATAQAPAGTVAFDVTNTGGQVTEFYLYGPGDAIVGEVENVGPGTSRRLVVQVPRGGQYQAACKPGMTGGGIRTAFTVTGGAAPAVEASAATAVASYQSYVQSQARELVTDTGKFVDAVKAGDVARAKALYPEARVYWERIEPVAEKLGDLDAMIDARENDVPAGQTWTGFHRLEKDLWADGLEPDSAKVADDLLGEVKEVEGRVEGVELTPVDLANGAKELLDEVATSKVTGEEERYSHTDLWDFAANVEGARAAIDALRPVLARRDAALLSTVDARFTAADQALSRYRQGAGYVAYTTLTPEQVKELSAAVDALSEPLSRTAGVVAAQ